MLASDVEYREDTFTACSCSVLAPTGLTAFCELAILGLGSVTRFIVSGRQLKFIRHNYNSML